MQFAKLARTVALLIQAVDLYACSATWCSSWTSHSLRKLVGMQMQRRFAPAAALVKKLYAELYEHAILNAYDATMPGLDVAAQLAKLQQADSAAQLAAHVAADAVCNALEQVCAAILYRCKFTSLLTCVGFVCFELEL